MSNQIVVWILACPTNFVSPHVICIDSVVETKHYVYSDYPKIASQVKVYKLELLGSDTLQLVTPTIQHQVCSPDEAQRNPGSLPTL